MTSLGLSFIIFLIGTYGLLINKEVVKSLISFNVMQAALIMMFLNVTALDGNQVPIYTEHIKKMVDPLPQALMLTAIVIGASITALILMMSIKLFHYFGTLEWKKILERDIL